MGHVRACPSCGTIGEWNWAKDREEKIMPNGERNMVKVIKKDEKNTVCPLCGLCYNSGEHQLLGNMLGILSEIFEKVSE